MFRLMCITAHPDDEVGSFGGTLRLYHERGVETFVLCLTPGQAGRYRGAARNDEELAALRRQELAAAATVLGISKSVALNYADGQLHRLDLYNVVCEVTRHIREFTPQVVMTFGADGAITGHLDHSMASVFATLATQWAGRNNRYPDHFRNGRAPHRVQKLYHATANFILPDRPPVTPAPITAVIDVIQYVDLKVAAFRAHATQAPLFSFFERVTRQHGTKEMFHLAATIHPGPSQPETDLFAGVRRDEQA